MVGEVIAQETWPIDAGGTVVAARERAREVGRSLGFSPREAETVAIAVSELGNNILDHAGKGEVVIETVREAERVALVVTARDHGPGISDIEWALTDGCSSAKSLGCGLGAVRRLMDELEIDSVAGQGTVVRIKKWLHNSK